MENETKEDEEHKVIEKSEFRCPIFGTMYSGKSTFVQQVRIINNHLFNDKELQKAKQLIAVNIYSAISTLIDKMSLYEYESLATDSELLGKTFSENNLGR